MNNPTAKKGRSLGLFIACLGIALSLLRTGFQDSLSELSFSFQPELYHGEGKTHHFFEGWYHKIVRTRTDCTGNGNLSDDHGHSLSMAVVPGVFYDSGNNATGKNESHAFIFVTVNGEKQHYYRFNLETEFQYRRHNSNKEEDQDWYVKIGNNKFSKHGMSLDLVPRSRQNHTKSNINSSDVFGDDDASISLKGFIKYEEISPWPIPHFWNLGAMGPVGYFLSPFLECYHDVLSMDHKLNGSLVISNHSGEDKEGRTTAIIDSSHPENIEEFINSECVSSRGYVEKDRGQSFPSLWIWMQTNSFRKQPGNVGTSLFFSVARIPILTTYLRKLLPNSLSNLEFPGFTAAIYLDIEGAAKSAISSNGNSKSTLVHTTKRLIPFATWTGAYFEDLVVEDERVVATINSGGIGGGFLGVSQFSSTESAGSSTRNGKDATGPAFIRMGRFFRAWIGSWFLDYDSRHLRYRLELVADRRVPHVLLYAPKTTNYINRTNSAIESTSKMEPFVNEALNANVHVRLFEYYRADDGKEYERLLLDDIGEHAGLEVHQNVQYLIDNLCGDAKANRFMCL